MPSSAHAWTVLCRACDLVIGTVEDGRFLHDPACTSPLAIGAGLMRCCQCGGRLTPDAWPVAEQDVDEHDVEDLPPASLLLFMPSGLSGRDTRQRL
jgi:hypothetical protein